ncbi:MAG: hypothetical protein QE485_10750 [Acidovorax sp.]|uniref:hypothetical protein n=1 Tax=Acidovorax sp. TaxID=1872122 RepID=UPI0026329F81|nr:hypothetical protein [Acidovorax sp.]MDH4417694.1 hypothetical protein [Acidovorax sp.]
MSKSAYRWLVILSFGIPTLSMIGDFTFFAHLMPQGLKDAMDRHIAQEMANPSWVELASYAVTVAIMLALPFQVYGLLRFRSWALKLAIGLSVVSYALMPFFGAAVYSGPTVTAMSLGSVLWGMILLLPYVSPEVRSYFGLAAPNPSQT